MANLEEEMIASYEVTISGIDRTKAELKKLDDEIRLLRATKYSDNANVSGAGNFSGSDIFVTEMDQLEGRIQPQVQNMMLKSMTWGKGIQATALRAAVTYTGLTDKGKRKGPGRDKTGALIKAITSNVEIMRNATSTVITGWHGWAAGRPEYFNVQERGSAKGGGHSGPGVMSRKKLKRPGSGGVPAANSLGIAIVPVREFLKHDLEGLKK